LPHCVCGVECKRGSVTEKIPASISGKLSDLSLIISWLDFKFSTDVIERHDGKITSSFG
jgi:hypothetical protein